MAVGYLIPDLWARAFTTSMPLIAACVTTLWPDFRLRITDFALPRPELPHFTLPHFALSEEDKWLVAMCVCIALVFLALLLADLVIRRRIASSRN